MISAAQTNNSGKIIGTWGFTDKAGKKQQYTIAANTWTCSSPIPYTGKWKFIKNNKIEIIFNDKPREEIFIEIIELDDTTMIIKQSEHNSMRKAVKYVLKKE